MNSFTEVLDLNRSNNNEKAANLDYHGESSKVEFKPKSSINSIKSELSEYKCKVCGKKFKYESSLKRHENDFHNGPQSWPCQFCQKVFTTKSNLQTHLSKAKECNVKREELKAARKLNKTKNLSKLDRINATALKVGTFLVQESLNSNESPNSKESRKHPLPQRNQDSQPNSSEGDELILQLCPNKKNGCKELIKPNLLKGHFIFCAFPPFKENESKISIEGAIHLQIISRMIGTRLVFNASLHERGILFCMTITEFFTKFEVVKFKDVVCGFNESKSKFIIRFTSSDPTAKLLLQPIQVGLRDDAEVLNHILAGHVKVNIEVIKSD